MKRSIVKLFSLQNIIALATIVFAVIFWFYKIDKMPKQIENHEIRISTLERESIEYRTKQDLLLQAVYEIRAVLLKKDVK
ncbi:MAG: hypothetical protein IKB70_00340 [Bacilli bacterium]|nr:hypothetical protein [Bacilli bacterium]